MKKLYLSLTLTLIVSFSFAQNWQFVGSPHVHQTTSFLNYFYFHDLEINASGEVFAGYYDTYSGINKLNFARYDGVSWTLLPTPDTVTANGVDIEVDGGNYYFAYSRVISSSVYAYVLVYNGSSWTQQGDSLFLGSSGGGWSFDLLIDNNGSPILVGVVASVGANKEVYQYGSATWNSTYTIPNSSGILLKENSAIIDSLNKLYVATIGFSTQYFTRIIKIDGATSTQIGDTIFSGANSNHSLKFDGAGVPHICFNALAVTEVMAYKLNGSTWDFIGDTSGASIGTMISADVAGDGTIIFNVLNSNAGRSVYSYSGGIRTQMDSIVCTNATPTPISDIVIPAGSTDVYALVPEVKVTAAQDFNVMKHALPTGIHEPKASASFAIYPNPVASSATISLSPEIRNAEMRIYDVTGREVMVVAIQSPQTTFHKGSLTAGIYFYNVSDQKMQIASGKIAVE